MTVMDNNALLAHIAAQVESNVRLLAEHGYVPRSDADSFLNTLAAAGQPAAPAPAPTRTFSIPTPFAKKTPAPAPVPAAPSLPQARAVWGYNENGTVRTF